VDQQVGDYDATKLIDRPLPIYVAGFMDARSFSIHKILGVKTVVRVPQIEFLLVLEIEFEHPRLPYRAAARLRRSELLKAIKTDKAVNLTPVPPNPSGDLSALEKKIRQYSAELLKAAAGDERKKLEIELAELNDRSLLDGMMPMIRDEVARLKTIHFLGECLADSRLTLV